jgi:hypothetical protein
MKNDSFRYSNFNGAGKTIAAGTGNGTLSFTGNDLPSTGVVAYHFATSGTTANTILLLFGGAGARMRVKADGQTIFDLDQTHYRKWLERFSQANYSPATSAVRFSIWFNFLDIVDDNMADTCQFPGGTVPTVEFDTVGSTMFAGALTAGWTQTTQDAHYTPYLYQQALNIGASAIQAQFPITVPGSAGVRGIVIPTTNIKTFRFELNQYCYVQAPGALYTTATSQGDMFLEMEQIEDGTTITTHTAHRIPMIQPAGGISRALLDTGASWAVTDALTMWLARPVVQV